jgi:MFS family permease
VNLSCDQIESGGPRASDNPRPGPSRLRRNLRYCTWDGILAAPTVFLVTPGNLVITVLLTQYYHLSTTQFGLLVALQAACSTLQLALVPWLNHRYSAKQLSVFGAWVQWAAFLALTAVIGWLPPAGPTPVFPILFGVFLVIAAMQALMAITWPSWVQEFTPERIRGKYFGRRNMILQIITVVFLVLMGSCLAQAGVDHGLSVKVVLMVLIGFSMLVRTGSIWMQQRTFSPVDLHVPAATVRRSEPAPWWEQLREILQRPNLLIYFGFGAAYGFTSNLMGPFFNIFMLDVLHMSTSQVTTLVVLSCCSGALTMAGWGRMIDRFGNRPVMVFCLIGWMLNGYLWTVTTPERIWLLYPVWTIAGVFQAGFLQGVFGLLLKIVPPETKTVAIAINAAVISLPAAVAPVIGGALLQAFVDQGWDKLEVYQWASASVHTLVLLTVFILRRVEEPRSQPVGQLVGAMRSYRQVASMLGLSFITEYLFFRKQNPRP